MDEKPTAFILLPHKSLDQIEKEYGVKFDDETINQFINAANTLVEGGTREDIRKKLREIAKRLKVDKNQIDGFVNDVERTLTFYLKSLLLISLITEKEG
ncbi:MAG: hypothetical protein ACTSXX_02085 [Candidatus Baldrarchaeia archaeon]